MRTDPDALARLDALAARTFEHLGGRVVLAAPLGIGKPNAMVDAFYRRAQADQTLSLRIFTALALTRPGWSSELERRLAEPIQARIFGNYPDPQFALDMLADALPSNVVVTSFYFAPGSALGSERAQRSHTNTNYTHVIRGVVEGGVNCLCQSVAVPPQGEEAFAWAELGGEADGHRIPLSLSSNPDLTLDLLPHLMALRSRGEAVALLAQVNRQLPFMYGDAVVASDVFDEVVDDRALDHTLFGPPSQPVDDADWALGLNASALVRDGGTLQLGIGALGDAVSRLLLLRHRENDRYRALLEASGLDARQGAVVDRLGGRDTFDEGLYGASEMLMQGLLELVRGGVMTREAEDGHPLHACFFLGPPDFYEALRRMPVDERRRISMTRISEVNELYGDEARKRRERRHARFLNTGIVATLLGAVASDGLDEGRVVSGVGGQYNFVAMAHALDEGRSILMVRSVREAGGEVTSNVRFSYGHATIPRHLRDIVVTEYGVADLRGRSDEEVVQAMLCVADSRFQDDLLDEARRAGKVGERWEIPTAFRENAPERIRDDLAPFRAEGVLPEYPFGSVLTDVERGLLRALRHLKRAASGDLSLPALDDIVKTLTVPDAAAPYLERMGLDQPEGLQEQVMRRAVVYGLAATDEV
jgi:hypothetical protein